MNEIETSLKEYRETLALANLDLAEVPFNVRAGRESQKRQAQADLEKSLRAYSDSLLKTVFAVVLTGPGTDRFIEVAQEEADVIVIDASAMFKRIADRVKEGIGTSWSFGVSQYGTVIQELRAIAGELNVFSLPSPKWVEPVNVTDEEGLLKHVTQQVFEGCGPDILFLYLRKQMVEQALADDVTKTTPVLIKNLYDRQGVRLFGSRCLEVEVTKTEKIQDQVLDTFGKIKAAVKVLNKKS